MNHQDDLERVLSGRLAVLKDAMRDERAPERVEQGLLDAFRRQPRKPPVAWWRRWEFAAVAAMAAVAAVAVTALGLGVFRGRGQEPAPIALTAPPAAITEPRPPAVVPAVVERPEPRAASAAPRNQTPQQFIPLVPDLNWMPGESAQILRVSMPRTALRSLGLPVDESRAFETVRADIVVGQDMVARAIRLVR